MSLSDCESKKFSLPVAQSHFSVQTSFSYFLLLISYFSFLTAYFSHTTMYYIKTKKWEVTTGLSYFMHIFFSVLTEVYGI